MRKIKTPRDAGGMHKIKGIPTSHRDAESRRVPVRTGRNIRHSHSLLGARDIKRIDLRSWEPGIARMSRGVEKKRYNLANRFYDALENTQETLQLVKKREQELQTTNEEMEATNEELQATSEELQATNEEMEATNEEIHATSEELQQASVYARNLIESSLDALVTIGPAEKIMDVNKETETMIGRSREELLGTDFSDYFTDPEKARAGYEQALKSGFVRGYPLDLRHIDGHTTPILYNAAVYRDEAGQVAGVFTSARDITEQKKTEQKLNKLLDDLKGSQAQLIQAGKMSAVGTMTAGVAHELNNPMMSILNFVQYCIKHTDKDDRKYNVLKDAEQECKRSSKIITNLLTFSRMESEGEEEYQKEDLAEILDRIFKLSSYRIKKDNILLTHHIADGVPAIWIKANNIQQVIFNLINNAMDSLATSIKKEIHVDIHREGEFVQLTIADTGCGISSEHLEKIYDPFFTTKPVGLGTGLGLSISHSIIKAHEGTIMVETEPGKGSKFKILLPIGKRKREKR
ncbi:PAS domain S-box protein [Desulforhopalus vacuolatus]|uniref:ATP-binding protein n=1 Tax=Desulforhopalus vacuolatus TaxID=40414 RepID=UPI0019633580|nr:ATP-binding protein [Desulforhopalus vacuolatus]MBM9520910.1 PAS domain S-box protein [Desulforhopalus vacuolatus]